MRYKSILIAINNLKNEFDNLVSIEIDENVVNWPEYKISDLEKFPYHFNYNTYKYFAKQLYFIVNIFFQFFRLSWQPMNVHEQN